MAADLLGLPLPLCSLLGDTSDFTGYFITNIILYLTYTVDVLQIWAGVPAGFLVMNMFAKDLDAGENGTVTHSLVTGGL